MQICKKADAVGIIYGSQPCQWLVMRMLYRDSVP